VTKSFERGVISNVSGYAEILRGNFEQARDHLAIGRDCHAVTGSVFGEAFSTCYRGLMEAIQGRLNEALRVYTRADTLDSEERQSASRAVIDSFAADVLYEQNQLREARDKLHDCLPVTNEFAYCGIVNAYHLTMIRLLAAEGDFARALGLLDEAEDEGARRGHLRLVGILRWERVRLALTMGDLAEANAAAKHAASHGHFGVAGDGAYLHYPEELDATDLGAYRLMIHNGRSAEALRVIAPAITRAEAGRRVWRATRLRILKVVALHASGEREPAQRNLRAVLRATAREGFVRSFLDEGPLLTELLNDRTKSEDACAPDGECDALERLKGHLESREGAGTVSGSLIGTLSEREQELVSCLNEGWSNKEISARLHLSEHTVKWHLRNIYDKLGVRSRTSALAALRRNGLL